MREGNKIVETSEYEDSKGKGDEEGDKEEVEDNSKNDEEGVDGGTSVPYQMERPSNPMYTIDTLTRGQSLIGVYTNYFRYIIPFEIRVEEAKDEPSNHSPQRVQGESRGSPLPDLTISESYTSQSLHPSSSFVIPPNVSLPTSQISLEDILRVGGGINFQALTLEDSLKLGAGLILKYLSSPSALEQRLREAESRISYLQNELSDANNKVADHHSNLVITSDKLKVAQQDKDKTLKKAKEVVDRAKKESIRANTLA
ncbi:hypothetical protein OWV82_006716 [Melia azedarach]|uniref:Uncharacterized protein n=1 Tax=Melia azedarach TaxID=155640 RepID=A0ACC1YJF1_MELAZ|nr:hypothetical protein OWV82_006716 [Melia azedarach]